MTAPGPEAGAPGARRADFSPPSSPTSAPNGGLKPALLLRDQPRRRRLLKSLLALPILLAFALLLGTLIPRGPAGGAGQGARILVLAGPIHTDLALPLDAATRARFAHLVPHGVPLDDSAAAWLVVGWGGRSFYLETPTWSHLRPGPVLRSLGWDASVLHVTVAGPLDESHPAILPLDLAPDARTRIEDAILATFALTDDGSPIPVASPGYPWPSRFFEAQGGFNLLLGCNTWTAAVLREGGLATGLWTPFPQTLLASLRLHAL